MQFDSKISARKSKLAAWEDPAESLDQNQTARLICTASVSLLLPLHVSRLPEQGTSVMAHSSPALIGGGFISASAASRQGIPTYLAAPLGTGPNSHLVRGALREEGIKLLMKDLVGDIGISITLIQDDGLTSSVRSPGVESEPQLSDLRDITLNPEDIVLITGSDLAGNISGEVLNTWIAEIPDNVRIALATGPAIADVPQDILVQALQRASVVTMNQQESGVLTRRLDVKSPFEAVYQNARPECNVIVRYGSRGCAVQEARDKEVILLPAFERERIDTTGVGETHTGVLLAELARGTSLVESAMRANAAGAIAVETPGLAHCPRPDDIDNILTQDSGTRRA